MPTIKTCTVSLIGSALIGSALIGHCATAAPADKSGEPTDQSAMAREEVVVTARRREESVQTVPVAVTAIPMDELVNRSALVLSDIAKETPSLTLQSRPGDNNTQIAQLRGQVQTDSAATLDPSVGLYLNDIYVARNNGANFELFDVDRVEVLAGPQGTLYGRNTTGGAIKLITTPADLKGTYNGYGLLSVGNYNSRRIEGALNVPVNEVLALRIAGLDNTRDGYGKVRVGTLADPSGLDGASAFTVNKVLDTDDKNTTAGRLSATFAPTDQLRFSLMSDYSKLETNGTVGYDLGDTLIAAPPRPELLLKPFGNGAKCSNDFYTSCANFAPESNAKTYGVSLTGAYDTDIGTAKLIYGHRKVDSFYKTDLEGTQITFENLDAATDIHQNSVEAQLQGKAAALSYTVGLYYFKEAGDELLNDLNFLSLGTRSFISQVNNESKSLYGQTEYNLTETLRLTTGARYTRDTKGIDSTVFIQPGLFFPNGVCLFTESGFTVNPTPANCRFQREDGFSHLSWTLGLDWQPRDGMLVYLKGSDGYRSGGQNVRGVSAATQRPFDDEHIRDVELGLKSRLAASVLLNLTYYHSNYSDIQTTQFLFLDTPQAITTVVINQGTATVDGLEAQSTLIASDQLSFDITGSYTDVNYSTVDVAPQLAPKYKGALGANFLVPFSFGDLTARLSYSYQAAFNNSGSELASKAIPETVTGSRGLVDARLSANLKAYDLTVALFGTNLTNKQYPEVVLPLVGPNMLPNGQETIPGAGPILNVFNRVQVGAPRMVGLELRKRF